MAVRAFNGLCIMTDTRFRALLNSISVAALFISAHHLLELGLKGALIGPVILAAAYGLAIWLRRTGSPAALVLLNFLSLWVVVGFGLVHGLFGHLLPFGRDLALGLSPAGAIAWVDQLTGAAMFFAAAWVSISAVMLLHSQAEQQGGAVTHVRHYPVLAPLVSLALIGAATAAQAYDNATHYRVAIVAPLSGPQAVLVQSFVRAAEMAKDDLGPQGKKFRLVMVDTTGGPDAAKNAVQNAFRSGRIDAVLGAVSASGQFTAPLAREARIPHLCVCSVKTIGDGLYNFTNIPLPEDEGARWAEEARRRGIHSIAIVAQDEKSVTNHANAMKAAAIASGIEIKLDHRFAGPGADFPALAAEAKAAGADVVFAEAFPPLVDDLVSALRRQGVANIASVVAPSASASRDLYNGIWYTDTNLVDPRFEQRFEERFPGVRFAAHMTPYAYDSFKLLAGALTSGQDPAAYLQKVTRYDGAAGIVTRNGGTGNFRSRPGVWEIRAGRPQQIEH
jgi:ABC-type branched-subunit amino acid transport system substrate-binding protein